MSISIQKRHPYTRILNSETPGDSKTAFVHCGDVLDKYVYLSVGSTCTYLELPATKVTTASSMAAAGMAKPMVQLTLSWTYTRVVTARKDPKLMAK